MLNTRIDVAKTVASALIELEKQIDGALVTSANLQIASIEGRRRAKLPLDAGQAGLEQVATAVTSLIAARKAVHDAHLSFRDVQDKMRIKGSNYGDYGDTPRFYDDAEKASPALAIVNAA